ncbi:hypothetical protein FOA52_010515 [Chlamydomonas sp. UWO 241]|nr:hypothetical protein FOA52_010515 [Chlamydomonas sp. UWO 241]
MADDRGPKDQPATMFMTIVMVFLWYTSNIVLLLLNKFLLSSTSFKQPVFLTLCHMVACVMMSAGVAVTGWMPLQPLRSRMQFMKIASLSAVFCFSIVLGNASLRFLPVSFTQAIGATTPFFTAIFAFVMMGSRESLSTYMTLVPIVGGIAIASGGEPLFHMLGFCIAMAATAGRALKSVLQGLLMSEQGDKVDPMSLLFYMGAVSVTILVPLTLIMEPNALAVTLEMGASKGTVFYSWLALNSMMAYFVNLTNFLVTKYTSPLTLQVLGNVKGVVAAIISILIFVNPVTVSGVLGYALTVMGVVLYSASKRLSGAKRSLLADQASKDDKERDKAVVVIVADKRDPAAASPSNANFRAHAQGEQRA